MPCGHVTPQPVHSTQEVHAVQVYRKVSIPLRRYGVTLAKMDGTDPASSELKRRFGVNSFPTIKLLWWGQVDERLSFAVSMIRGEEDLMVRSGARLQSHTHTRPHAT